MRFTPFPLIVVISALVALAACSRSEPNQSAAQNASAGSQLEGVKGVDRSHRGSPAPNAKFVNGDGEETGLTEVAKGKPLLVNLWASWCAPCVKELPTLDM